jgi:acyl dehydratase
MTGRYFEDFEVGQTFQSRTYEITAEKIKAFAREFDPQPFHVDEEAAKGTFFKWLAASGWHTASIAMKLLVEGDIKIAGGTIGGGAEDLRWPQPVRPGDVLRLEGEVLEMRRSRSRPELGIVKVRLTLRNQANEPVQISTPALMVPTRNPAGG